MTVNVTTFVEVLVASEADGVVELAVLTGEPSLFDGEAWDRGGGIVM